MHIKSNSNLKTLLMFLYERAESSEASQGLSEAIDHMGPGSPYRGGRYLIEILTHAQRDAEAAGDPATAEGLRDAIAYAKGTLLDQDVEDRYDLYDGRGQELTIRMLERVTSGLWGLAHQETVNYLSTNPMALAGNVRDHFEALTRTALRFVRLRRAGHYGAFRVISDFGAWTTDVLVDRVDLPAPAPASLDADPRIAPLIDSPHAEILLAGAQVVLRRRHLDRIRLVVENPYSREESLRRAVTALSWLWGGEFVEVGSRRRLVPGNEVDITLLRPGGVLHAVELKRANVRVAKPHRAEYVLSAEVHDAVGQMANYLRAFDERRLEIFEEHNIEVRRAHGTVVIGHPMFQPDPEERIINETLRTYTSHLSRIDVMTYKDLIDGAERTLDVADSLPSA